MYIVAVLALCGMPPSPLFVTELQLIKLAGPVYGGIILLLLFVVFSGMTYHALRMVMGKASVNQALPGEIKQLEHLSVIPSLVLILVLLSGLTLTALMFLTDIFRAS